MSRIELLGINIKKAREKRGWSQAYLAEKLHLCHEYICHIEKGRKYISLRKLFELADILETDFCELTNFK